jgi:hypothetical protein
MLWNVDDVVRRTAVLMDDPAMTEFDKDYTIPFLNQRWDDISTELSMLGLDYQEVTAIIADLPPNTTDLSAYMQDNQPLMSMMLPRRIQWKPIGTDDTEYQDAVMVEDLDDFPPGVIGIPQWAWTGGNVLLVPSSVDVTLRVRFDAMSATLVDPEDQTIRGVTNILAYKTAELIYSIRGNDALSKKMADLGLESLDNFERAAVMRDQAKLRRVPPMHPKLTIPGFYIAPNLNQ